MAYTASNVVVRENVRLRMRARFLLVLNEMVLVLDSTAF
jgi:hypothetical protein